MRNIYSVLKETMRKKGGKHEKNIRYSKYELEMKQIPTHV